MGCERKERYFFFFPLLIRGEDKDFEMILKENENELNFAEEMGN